jgi:hypothetical protein
MAQSLRISEKYLKSLRILKTEIDYNGGISLSKFRKTHQLSSDFAREIVNGGLISRVGGSTSKGFVYKWQTIEPNVMMVRELLKRLEKLNKIKNSTRKPATEKTQAVEKTQVVAIESGQKTISFEAIGLFEKIEKPVTEIETIATIETGEALEIQPQPTAKPPRKKRTLKKPIDKSYSVYLFGFKIFTIK